MLGDDVVELSGHRATPALEAICGREATRIVLTISLLGSASGEPMPRVAGLASGGYLVSGPHRPGPDPYDLGSAGRRPAGRGAIAQERRHRAESRARPGRNGSQATDATGAGEAAAGIKAPAPPLLARAATTWPEQAERRVEAEVPTEPHGVAPVLEDTERSVPIRVGNPLGSAQ